MQRQRLQRCHRVVNTDTPLWHRIVQLGCFSPTVHTVRRSRDNRSVAGFVNENEMLWYWDGGLAGVGDDGAVTAGRDEFRQLLAVGRTARQEGDVDSPQVYGEETGQLAATYQVRAVTSSITSGISVRGVA